MITEGTKAPDFTLTDETGTEVSLSQFRGKKVVVYFYPKDDTPGCTKEACSFRDNYDAILDKGAVVIGISADSEESHGQFKDKYDLPFYLLSDPERKAIEGFGAGGEKDAQGKTSKGIMRYTFVLDEEGTVIKAFPKVKPAEHATEVMEYL